MLLHHGVELRRLINTLPVKPILVASISDSYSLALLGRSPLNSALRTPVALSIEKRAYPPFDLVHVVSAQDREWLKRYIPALNVHVIPLGVNLPIACRDEPNTNVVGYLGSLGGLAGHEVARFLTSSWDLVQTQVPSAGLLLAGPLPTRRLRDIINLMPSVTYVGTVPDADAFLQSCVIAVAPSPQLSGMPNKALEAMANCRAVAGGRVLRGLPGARNDFHYLRRDTAEGLAEAIRLLLTDPAAVSRLPGMAANSLKHYHGLRPLKPICARRFPCYCKAAVSRLSFPKNEVVSIYGLTVVAMGFGGLGALLVPAILVRHYGLHSLGQWAFVQAVSGSSAFLSLASPRVCREQSSTARRR